jgi:hypothetical protein
MEDAMSDARGLVDFDGVTFEPTHFATAPGAQAVCGVALSHPFNVSTERGLIECDRCRERMRDEAAEHAPSTTRSPS